MIKRSAKYLLIVTASLVLQVAEAQKSPNVQTASVYAPANIKIDGKAVEWNDQFQAHNSAVNLYYTLSNDDDNLYLVVQATQPRIIEKILTVGLTLLINKNGKKSEHDNVTINYPLIKNDYTDGILVNAGDKANWPGMQVKRNSVVFHETLTRTDSTVMQANRAFNQYATNIGIKGISDGVDTLISIYNEQRIKAAGSFDNKGVFTCELALPLTYLTKFFQGNQTLAYAIMLNNWGHPRAAVFVPLTLLPTNLLENSRTPTQISILQPICGANTL